MDDENDVSRVLHGSTTSTGKLLVLVVPVARSTTDSTHHRYRAEYLVKYQVSTFTTVAGSQTRESKSFWKYKKQKLSTISAQRTEAKRQKTHDDDFTMNTSSEKSQQVTRTEATASSAPSSRKIDVYIEVHQFSNSGVPREEIKKVVHQVLSER